MDIDNPLVSVITPVRNGEKYMRECIDSVLAQTYQNWEYIIVDNCSTDETLKIAQNYRDEDERIRIYRNNTCLGMLPNWNHAMRQISPQSKYCKVLHADDWLFPDCIQLMVELAEYYPSVGIVGAYRLNEDRVDLDDLPYPKTVVSGHYICRRRFLGGKDVFGSPTSLLIRADLVRGRENFYNEQNLHADTEVCFDLLRNSDFGQVHQVLTYTRRHNEAASSFARKNYTHAIGRLIILKKYGRHYLNKNEYAMTIKKRLKYYYRLLAKNPLKLWDKKFRDYHKKSFNKIGESLSFFKLFGSIFVVYYNFLLDRLKIR